MNWTSPSHTYVATLCKITGKPCPVAMIISERLAQSVASAKLVTADDFEIEGQLEIPCEAGLCLTRFQASHERLRLFFGTQDDTALDSLNGLADMMFSLDVRGHVSPRADACMMVEGVAKKPDPRPRSNVTTSAHAH